MTSSALQGFRTARIGCEIAAFTDISTRTVLAWDSAVKWPQEQLDELSELASSCLALGASQKSQSPQCVTLARATGCHLFLRLAPEAAEALCLVFAPGADLASAPDDAVALLEQLVSSDELVGA